MLEIFALVLVFGAYFDASRRRCGQKRYAWAFVVVGLLGYLLIRIGVTWISNVPEIFGLAFGWAWVFLTYGSIFLVLGGGKRAASSWQCPTCRMINDMHTLICGCGEQAPVS